MQSKQLAITAGIWDARPLQYIDENGTARGTFPDIINYVARQEGWKVEYIFLSSSEGLQKLTKGEIADRVQAELDLQSSLQEKEILIRELYHRTRNNMQVINSWLKLQEAHSRNAETTRVFGEMQNRIHVMALVHQKLYQSQDLSRIDLKEYIQELVNLLTQTYETPSEKIAFVLDVESIPVLIDTAIPCGLILNELIANSMQHAFPGERRGEIHIHLSSKRPGEIKLGFSDNGVGVPKGFDFRRQDSLGLQSIVMITEHQLQGEVIFESDDGVAAHFRFADTLCKARV